MYITCQNCDTMFRLDEQLLKPSGSKVRCSQCSHVFVAYPPEPETPSSAAEKAVPPAAGLAFSSEGAAAESSVNKGGDGINLAELDAILDKGPSFDSELAGAAAKAKQDHPSADVESDQNVALKESDLNMDFELDDEGAIEKPSAQAPAADIESGAEDDLELGDFFLDEDEPPKSQEGPDQGEDLSLALDETPMEEEGQLPPDLFAGGDDELEDELEALNFDAGDQGDDLGLDELAASIESSEDELEELVLDDESGEPDLDLNGAQPEVGDSGLEEDVPFLPDDAVSEIEEDQLEDIGQVLVEAETPETELSLDEDDLELAEPDGNLDQLPAGAAAAVDKAPADIAESTSDILAEADGLDFDLDLDLDLELDDQKTDANISIEDTGVGVNLDDSFLDDVSFDDDLDLDLDKTELDLDEGGKTLTEAPPDQEPELILDDSAPAEASDDMEDLDLSDLGSLLDDDLEGPAETPDEPEEEAELSLSSDDVLEDSDELSFDNSALKEEPAVDLSSGDDDLDLGDLDNILSDGETADEALDLSLDDLGDEIEESFGEDVGEETVLSLDLDESLPDTEGADVSEEISLDKDMSGEAEGEDLEDLDFALDSEFENKPAAKDSEVEPPEAAEDEDAEIDLSDIEEMLEGGGLAADADSTPSESEVDFSEEETIAGDEFDLAEFEAAIDEAESDTVADKETSDEEDLDVELSLDEEAEPVEKAVEEDDLGLSEEEAGEETLIDGDLDLDLEMEGSGDADDHDLALESEKEAEDQFALEDDEFDLSDLSALADESNKSKKSEIVDSGDIELEFEIEEKLETSEPSSVSSEPLGKTGRTSDAVTELAMDQTITAPLESVEKPPKAMPKAVKSKKKTSKVMVVVLILILLGGGGYLGYDYIVKNDIEIPYLSKFLNPQPKDPNGTIHLATLEINSKFIENETGGRLFVITGKVRNEYQDTRGMITLRGKLFAKDKVLVKTEKTYAGITISDQELTSRSVQDIKTELKTAPKPQDIGAIMRPGQALPFMLVFSDLPKDLDEFVVETVSSNPVTR